MTIFSFKNLKKEKKCHNSLDLKVTFITVFITA